MFTRCLEKLGSRVFLFCLCFSTGTVNAMASETPSAYEVGSLVNAELCLYILNEVSFQTRGNENEKLLTHDIETHH